MARATNVARDAEVFAKWLDEARDGLTARQKVGATWLRQEVSPAPQEGLPPHMSEELEAALAELDRELPVYSVAMHLDGERIEPAFARVMSVAIRRAAARLRRRLERVTDAHDTAAIHEARIAGKRLRYLLEPMSPHLAGAPALIADLKRLQDALGDLHDTHVWLHRTRDVAEEHLADEARRLWEGTGEDEVSLAHPGPDIRPGLIAIAQVLRDRLRDGFVAAASDWIGAPAEPFFGHVANVVATCELRERDGVEIERKYLLLALPETWPAGDTVFIDQGYLPGDRLVERIRRTRSRSGVQYTRTVKSGIGLERVELEEETTREVFDALWPLTEGRRVSKRRHKVQVDALTWELDEFTDRELVLAEVELPTADHEVQLPDWLAPAVVREVTGEGAWANSTLAR
jgi:CYTH domain-containing protein